MINVLVRDMRRKHRHGEKGWEKRGLYSHAPKKAWSSARKGSPLEYPEERGPADTLTLDFWPP